MSLETLHALETLYALRSTDRRPGWDQKVRTAAISALVNLYRSNAANPTEAFLEIVIKDLEKRG